jgi:microcystin-dependent protein
VYQFHYRSGRYFSSTKLGVFSMAEPFVAEIKMFGGNFAPRGYATCDGQILSIAQNTALFSLLGTTYGGNGQTTFALPDLRGRGPMHPGQGNGLTDHVRGELDGSPSVTLINTEMPSHTHSLSGSNVPSDIDSPSPNAVLSRSAEGAIYAPSGGAATLNPLALSINGGNQPHNNMQPYLAVTFIIALQGIFPPRS